MNASNNSSSAGCCSVEDINNVVENAIIPCPDNSWRTATFYRNFIFPTGAKNVSYSCEDGILTPQLLSCMRKVFNISVNDSCLFKNLTSRSVFVLLQSQFDMQITDELKLMF